MAIFRIDEKYIVKPVPTRIYDFHDRKKLYVTRPPYQRKAVWSTANQRALLDSIFRGYYIPRLVLRQVTVGEGAVKFEVIDGQQRITVVQRFFNNELSLPKTLRDIRGDLTGMYYDDLPDDVKNFINYVNYDVDLVIGIEDPYDEEHQAIATEIFRRLQEGESLTYMEKAHARLSSLVRNFLVKYADDISFDFENYQPLDSNPSKLPFFRSVYRYSNDRMQHLAFLGRLLMFEDADGPADIKETDLTAFIESSEETNGINDLGYEKTKTAQAVLNNLKSFYQIFKGDPQVVDEDGMREFSTEYFTISVYLLLRHLRQNYVLDNDKKQLFHNFVLDFFDKWKHSRDEYPDILVFSDNRQQSRNEIEVRHRIIRQHFFEYARLKNADLMRKDIKRAFNEAERIKIYRKDRGVCQMCLEEGLPPEQAVVPWKEYEADHVVPHSRGGATIVENGQVLCRRHNRIKGATFS